jgi:hypothetical protein
MCRNIRTLYNFEPSATEREIRSAATQYVRKISGFNKPSRANEDAFERAGGRGCRPSLDAAARRASHDGAAARSRG